MSQAFKLQSHQDGSQSVATNLRCHHHTRPDHTKRQCDVFCVSNMPFPSTTISHLASTRAQRRWPTPRPYRITIRGFPAWDLSVTVAQLSTVCPRPADWLLHQCVHKCLALPVGTDSFVSLVLTHVHSVAQDCPSATHQQTQRAFFADTHCKPVPHPTNHAWSRDHQSHPNSASHAGKSVAPVALDKAAAPSLSTWQHTSVVLQI